MSSPGSRLSDDAVSAVRDALNAEHAAIWVYGLASAFAAEQRVSRAVSEAMTHHEARRDAAERLLKDAGTQPPRTLPSYELPSPVTDQTSAIEALITAETDCQIGWRSVLERTGVSEVRRSALDGLTTAATRATRWRLTIGRQPAAQAFPGQPSR